MKKEKDAQSRVHGAALGLLTQVEGAIAQLDGEDKGSLKQLTGVLKDLQDILDHGLALRERELKLKRMEQELCGESLEWTVRLEGEAERFAE